MTRHRQLNITLALALLIAAICLFGPIVMDGPSDLQALQDTAASVVDAQVAAVAARTTQLSLEQQP